MIWPHREAMGARARRIRIDRNLPLDPPHKSLPKPEVPGGSGPATDASRRDPAGSSICTTCCCCCSWSAAATSAALASTTALPSDGPAGRDGAEAFPVAGAAGVSPNPSGRIDSGRSCASAGSAATIPAAVNRRTNLLRRRIGRHVAFDAGLRNFVSARGQEVQDAAEQEQDDEKDDDQAAHGDLLGLS